MKSLTAQEVDEIRVMYRQARYKAQQIRILSQLYLVPEAEIRRVVGLACPKKQGGRAWAGYNDRLRLAAVEDVAGGMSCLEAARKYGVASVSTVRRWVAAAQKGAGPTVTPKFPEKVKKAALKDLAGGMTYAQAARKYGASVASLCSWVRKAKDEALIPDVRKDLDEKTGKKRRKNHGG